MIHDFTYNGDMAIPWQEYRKGRFSGEDQARSPVWKTFKTCY